MGWQSDEVTRWWRCQGDVVTRWYKWWGDKVVRCQLGGKMITVVRWEEDGVGTRGDKGKVNCNRCKGANQYCCADIQYLVEDYCMKAIHSQDDLGEYIRKFTKFTAILIANQKLSEMEHNIMFLAGLPMLLQDHVHHRLAIIKLDLHPDDPYLMDDVIAAVKFLLTRSAFQSIIPPIANVLQPNAQQPTPTPYHPFQEAAQPTVPIVPFNLPPALKTEANIAAHATLLCNWCVDTGHFTCNCQNALGWINSGRVIQGTNSRLYLPDGSPILHALGGWCLRDGIEHVMSLWQSAQQSAPQPTTATVTTTTCTSASSGFMRDLPPHLTVGILCAAYLDTSSLLDINLSVFMTMMPPTMDYAPTPVVVDEAFQPYVTEAWASFQADKASRKQSQKQVHFDGVKMLPHKSPNPDSYWATVTEEMEILSPELQQDACTPPAPAIVSYQPSRLSMKANNALIPSVSISAPSLMPVPVSTPSGQSRLSSAQSGVAGTIPPHAPPADQSLVPTWQYRYSFSLEDETAPQQVLDRVLNLCIPVLVKGLCVDVPGFRRPLWELIMVKHVIAPSAHVVAGDTSILPIPKLITSNASVFSFTISSSNLCLPSWSIRPIPLSSGYSFISSLQSIFNLGTLLVLTFVSSYTATWHALAYKPVSNTVHTVLVPMDKEFHIVQTLPDKLLAGLESLPLHSFGFVPGACFPLGCTNMLDIDSADCLWLDKVQGHLVGCYFSPSVFWTPVMDSTGLTNWELDNIKAKEDVERDKEAKGEELSN